MLANLSEFKILAVIGSRDYKDRKFIFSILDRFFKKNGDYRFIVSGGAAGADILSEAYARRNNLSRLIFRPQYKKFGKSATFKRNFEIVDAANYLIAFQRNKSRGTQHSIDYAVERGIPVVVFNEKNEMTFKANL